VAVLIDEPRWPAHGTVFSHLVSDVSLAELHAFADAAGILPRAFDHDHYDVPERRYADLVERGALPVSATVLVRRLLASGLRVRTSQRTPERRSVLPALQEAWATLSPLAPALGEELLDRWSEPHRRYHDVRHLAQCLWALDEIAADEPVADTVRLAAWFHDAVYLGRPGDEDESAALAHEALTAAGLPVADEVARLVRLTATHSPGPDDVAGAQLCDADLSILGQAPGRYHVYVRDVRLDFEHLSDADFRAGRLRVLDELLSLSPLFRTASGGRLWAARARANLAEERRRWLS
jgi:predicted metal-dependent HD superfamily phosphohydrolase